MLLLVQATLHALEQSMMLVHAYRLLDAVPAEFRRVEFRLRPGDYDAWIGAAESMWALSQGVDLYRLKNSPWCVRGVSYDDLVYAPIVDGMPTVERIVEHGGHFTLHARVQDIAAVPLISAHLNELGCGVETDAPKGGRTKLMAIDVPSQSALTSVREYLDAQLTTGRLDYEESALPLEQARPGPTAPSRLHTKARDPAVPSRQALASARRGDTDRGVRSDSRD